MQIEDYDKPAELILIQACREGGATIISWERPEKGNTDNTIRAGLIRALLLGTGDCTPPVRELQIRGAWISGKLDLAGEALPVPLGLGRCTLEEDVMLRDCTLPALYMPGTHLPKLDAHRLHCNGPLHLRDGFQATGLVDLSGAMITGQLSCADGKFLAQGLALNCNAITVGASVFLSGKFEAHGKVNLVGAKIDGQLACNGGKFLAKDMALNCNAISVGADVFLQGEFDARGRIVLNRAVIAGTLELLGATLTKGLDAQGMRVRAGFFWGDVTDDGITVDLINAQVGTLVDGPGFR